MVRNLLVRIREEDYLILRAFLEIHDLELDEFLDLITSNTEVLEAFLLQLIARRRPQERKHDG